MKFFRYLFQQPSFLIPLSAILLAIAYDFPRYGWPLALVGLVPFLFSIKNPSPLPIKTIFRRGFIFGSTFILLTNSWYIQAFPLDWANIDHPIYGSFLIIIFLSITSSVLGAFIGLWAIAFSRLGSGIFVSTLSAPSLWILCEYTRTFIFSIICAGPNGSIGTDWTFSLIGYAAAWSPLLPYASIGGIYLLSFVVISINISVFLICKSSAVLLSPIHLSRPEHNLKALRIVSASIILVVAIFLIPIAYRYHGKDTTKHEENLSVAVLHTSFHDRIRGNISLYRKDEVFDQLIAQIRQDGHDPDIIVFPEESNFLNIAAGKQRDLQQYFSNTLGEKERLIIDAGQMEINGEIGSAAFFYNTKDQTTVLSKKRLPVINGEYLPWITLLPLKLFRMQDTLENFPIKEHLTEADIRLGTIRGIKVNTLVCSEIYSPNLMRATPFDESSLIASPASHTIFHGATTVTNQSIAMAKVRAAESQRFFVSAGNDTPSFIIDAYGDMVSITHQESPSILYADVPVLSKKSPYAVHGNWIILSSIVITFILHSSRLARLFLPRKKRAII